MSTRASVLDALRMRDGFVSGEELAERMGVSRAAVWKHVAALKRAGFHIEGVRSRGYRLVAEPEVPDTVDAIRLGGLCNGRSLGCRVEHHERTASTNTDAMALGRSGAPEGTVVIAEEQTAGRGRLGRSWASARGLNLYMSVLLRPAIVPARAPQLALIAGLAVAAAVEEEGTEPAIKWPNDVLLAGRKVAGILTEIEAEADRVAYVVVGIGVNLNSRLVDFPRELHDIATSVRMHTGENVDRTAFAARLLEGLEKRYRKYTEDGFGALIQEWRRRSLLDGRTVTVSGAGTRATGLCVGIDDDGALLLETEPGRVRRVLAGDVSVEGVYR